MLHCDGEHLAWDFVSRSCFNLAVWVFYTLCLYCYIVEVLFVSCCICSCECLSYRV
jgi:hypothetical protein